MLAVVPPQTTCCPSFAKNRAIIRLLSFLQAGGPIAILRGSRFKIFKTQTVASSKGLPPYSLSVSSRIMEASTLAVKFASARGSTNSMSLLLLQLLFRTPFSLAYSTPSLIVMKISPSASSIEERYMVFSPMCMVDSGNS